MAAASWFRSKAAVSSSIQAAPRNSKTWLTVTQGVSCDALGAAAVAVPSNIICGEGGGTAVPLASKISHVKVGSRVVQ